MKYDFPAFLYTTEMQRCFSDYESLAGSSVSGLNVIAQASCLRAEARLIPFTGSAILDSRLVIWVPIDLGQCEWSQRQSTRIEMTRKSSGWALTDLKRQHTARQYSENLLCSSFELLVSSHQLTQGACADLFVRHLEEELFHIDEPLPGAYIHPAHSKPLNALGYCAFSGRPHWVELLLRMGADPLLHGAYGKTALHLCAQSHFTTRAYDCARLLLAAGANPQAINDSRKTPASSLSPGSRDTPVGLLLFQASATALESKRIANALKSTNLSRLDELNAGPQRAGVKRFRL